MRKLHLMLGAMLALPVGIASATPTVVQSPAGSGNNVIFASCSSAPQADGFTIQGCLNGNPTVLFDLVGTETLTVPSGGQARVEAAGNTGSNDGISFNSLRMGYTDTNSGFTELVFNILTEGTNRAAESSGNVLLEFTFLSGQPSVTTGPYFIDGTGNNFFTVTAGTGEVLDTVRVYSVSGPGSNPVEFNSILQVRVSDAVGPGGGGGPGPGTDVPAPASLALLGAGLAALGLRRARRA